jgi:hypothetical protein
MGFVQDLILIPALPAWNSTWLYVLVGIVSRAFHSKVYAYSAVQYPIYVVIYALYAAFLHPLSKYPGPRLWAMSKIPYDRRLLRGDLPYKIAELHEKYGPVVRIAPDELSYITDTSWNDIYGKTPGLAPLVKSPGGMQPPPKGIHGLLTAPSEADHTRMRYVGSVF